MRAETALVTCAHPLAAEAAVSVLREGGNAVDAAVTASLALGVVEPFMSGIGGTGHLVLHLARTGENVLVDGGGVTPAAATPDMYELADATGVGLYGWRGVRDDENMIGYRAIAVPGLLAVLAAALEEFGTIGLDRALAPAIELAEGGFEVGWYTSAMFTVDAPVLARFPAAAAAFLRDGRPLRPEAADGADRLVQPKLAATLRELARGGADVFYRGPVGEAIVDDVRAHGGLLTPEDLAGYRARVFRPAEPLTTYRGLEVFGAAFASGASTTAQMLNLFEELDLAAAPHGSSEAYHLVAEAFRLAFADRFAHMADDERHDVPYRELLSKEYAARRARSVDPGRAAPAATAGEPRASRGAGLTTHLCVVDGDRNVVSLTQTLLSLFGSRVVAGETGVLMNNGMMWFDPVPGSVNSIEGGKRALNAASPLLLVRDGRPALAVGAAGGRKVISSIAQVAANVVEWGLPAQEAVEAPRVHCEGGDLFVDVRVPEDVRAGLAARGHRVVVQEESPLTFLFGLPNAIVVDERTGALEAGVDHLRPTAAIGY